MTESQQDGRQAAAPEEPIAMTGAQMVWEALVREGVHIVFGHPGGAILPTYDALSSYEAEGKIHHVLVRHEQCAAHMADGYSRATGRVGVCIATSGPAATNLVTGLATALMDSVPIVAITGPGVHQPAGYGRLSGVRRGGRDAAGVQAQLSCHRCQRTAHDPEGSLLCGARRPPRPRAGGHL